MTRSILEPADLQAILTAQPPTAELGDLVWVLGDAQAARAIYEAAWRAGQAEALVTVATLDHVSHIPNTSAPLIARQRDVLAASRASRIEAGQARELLEFLGLLAAYRLHDFDEAVRLTVTATDQCDVDPFLFAGMSSAELPESSWTGCLEALVERAGRAHQMRDRHRLLLTAVMLGAEVGHPDLSWYERLIRVARGEINEVFLLCLLQLLDQVESDSSALSRSDVEQYLGPLAEHISDSEERFAYRLRQLDGLSRAGATAKAIDGLRSMADGPAVDGRAATLERCQRMAVAADMFDVGAEMAATRARRTSDPQLKYSLWLRAEELHRLARTEPQQLLDVARELAAFARRSGRSAPAVLDHTYRVLEALALQCGLSDQLISIWDERELVAGTQDLTLRRILYRRADDDLVPQSSGMAALLGQLHARMSPMTVRATLSLIFVGGGFGAMATELHPQQLPSDFQAHAARLRAYCACFHGDDPVEAMTVFEALFREGDQRPETLWGLLAASLRAGKLGDWTRVFAERALAARTASEKSLFAALEAAALGELGRPDRGLELARALTAQNPRDAAASLLTARLSDAGDNPVPLDLGTTAAVRALLDDTSELRGMVEGAEKQIVEGRTRQGAALLSNAARRARADKPELAAALLIRAGGVLGADMADPDGAERYFLEARQLQPDNPVAWRSLCSLYSRTGQHPKVAELLSSLPAVGENGALPVEDLRRSARALSDAEPEGAAEIYRLLIRTAGLRPVDRGIAQDLDDSYDLAKRAGRIPEFRNLLERLVVQSPSESLRGILNFRLGEVYADELRDVDLAVEHLRRALNAPSTRQRASRRLRDLLAEQGRWEELVEVLLASAEFVTDDVERVQILMSAAETLWTHLTRPEAAAEALQAVLRLDGKHLPALLRLSEYHRSSERWQTVVDLLEQAARLVEDKQRRSKVYQELGEVYEAHLRSPQEALENYLVSFMCDSTNEKTFARLDHLYTAMKRYRELAGVLNIAIETAQREPEASSFDLEALLARRAHLEYKYLSQPAQAAESLIEALRINPSNERYLRLVEGHLLEQADPDTVLQAYEIRAAALPPDSAELPELIRAQAAFCERLPERLDQAMAYYDRLLELDPADRNAFAKLERHYSERRQWSELIALYRRQLKWVHQPEQTVSLHHRIARIYETERRDLEAAADTYADLLKLVPASISALRGLGRLYEAMRRWDDLIAVSEREVKLVEDDRVKAHLLFKIGSIHETHRSDEERAIAYYERAVENDPRCVPALHGLRDIFQRRGQPERVIEYLEREATIWDSPREQASIHTRIAEVHWEDRHDHERAIEHLKRALSLVPDSGPALARLLDIYFARGAWAEAAPIAYSLSQHPESIQADRRSELFLRRGIIAYHLGNRREAIESLKIALDIAPDSTAAFQRLSDILNEEGDADAHADFFARLQKEFADRTDPAGLARVKRFLGRQAENRRDLREAASAYAEAIALDPGSVAGLRDLIRVHVRIRDFESAHRVALDFAQSTPSAEARRAAQVSAARILLDHLDRRAQARALLDEVLTEDPHQPEALFLGAQAAFLDEDWSRARALMETLVRLDAQQSEHLSRAERAEHLYYVGRILDMGDGDEDGALSYYARAREESPTDPRPLKAAALVLYRQKNWHRLDGLLDRALRGAAASGGQAATVPLLLFRAKLAHLRDQDEQAQEYLKRLLDIAPDYAEARALLVELVRAGRPAGDTADRELRGLLRSNIFDGDALHGMAFLAERRGLADEAACYREVLHLIRDPRASDMPRAAMAPNPPGPLSESLVTQFVRSPVLASGYVQALALLGPDLGRLGLARPAALPAPSRLLEAQQRLALEPVIAELARTRPGPADRIRLYREGPTGTAVTAAMDTSGPCMVVEIETDLENERERAEVRFILAHALELLAAGTYTIELVPRSDLTHLLWWLSRWAQDPAPEPPHDEAPWAAHLGYNLTDALRDLLVDRAGALEPLADPQHAQRLAIALEAATTEDADRMGLVLCGDLHAAVGALLKFETGAGLEMVRSASDLARSRRVGALVRYAVSAEYVKLRSHLRE